jgi:hypothetical protein
MPGNSSTISPTKSRWFLATSRFLIPGPLPCGSRSLFCRSFSVRSSSCACMVRGKYLSSGRSRRLPTIQLIKHHLENAGRNIHATFACHHHCHILASVFRRLLSPSSFHAPRASCASPAGFPTVLGVLVAALALQSIRSSHS